MIKVHLKAILKDKNMSLSELSKLSGVSQKVLGTFQNQKTESIHYPTIEKITSTLGIDVGDLITNEENIYELDIKLDSQDLKNENLKEIKASLVITDVLNNEYIIDFEFEIVNQFDKVRTVSIKILKMSYIYFPEHFQNLMNQRSETPFKDTLYKILSYILVQEIMQSEKYHDLNIYDNIYVDFKNLLPKFICLEISNDILKHQSQSDIFVFSDRVFEVFLVPSNPKTKILEYDPDLQVPYLPYIDSLITYPNVYEIKIDEENFKRKLFMYF